jgi:outer membrane usher protein FimD/PapC
LRLALLSLSCVPGLVESHPTEVVEFDEKVLKLRGIDPTLAAYFRDSSRFTAGRHVVEVSVNGSRIGHVSARFNRQGELCVDRALLAAVHVDPGNLTDRTADSACLDLRGIYSQARVEVDPARATIALLVPTDALLGGGRDLSGYTRGGVAAMANYDIVGMRSRNRSGGSRYASANTELGFNAGDWILRSRQASTINDGRRRTEVLDSYAQRSFADYRAVLQAGQINLINPVLSGAQVIGAQITSELALAPQDGAGAVDGMAHSPSRVEVRQDGVLVYSTVVPAGPFSLAHIPRIQRSADLDVMVIGEDGQSQHFVVTAAMAGQMAPSIGYSFGVGRVRNTSGAAPWVMSGGWSGSARRGVLPSGGVMLATGYRAAGAGMGWLPAPGSQLQLNISVAQVRSRQDRALGMQASAAFSQRLSDHWALGLAQTRQSLGFRAFVDHTTSAQADIRRSRYRDQSSASLSWSHRAIGSLTGGYARTRLHDRRMTRRALASWSKYLGGASVALSAEWQLGDARQARDNSIYLNISLPLGAKRRLSSSARRYGGDMRYGAQLTEQVNEYASYRAGLEYQPADRRRGLSAGVSLLPRYFQLDSSYTQSPSASSYSLGLRGGMVLHRHGLTASPYPVRETFGVLDIEDTPGVRVSTPAGPVWTDARGYAVLPQLSAFGESRIEVVTDSLPRHLDIDNGTAVVAPWRGAVASLRFGVSRTRRVLLAGRTVDGRDLPAGAAVTDDQGEFISLVQGNGQIFVPNALAASNLWVSAPGLARCRLVYLLPDHPDPNAYYELAAATCQAEASAAP